MIIFLVLNRSLFAAAKPRTFGLHVDDFGRWELLSMASTRWDRNFWCNVWSGLYIRILVFLSNLTYVESKVTNELTSSLSSASTYILEASSNTHSILLFFPSMLSICVSYDLETCSRNAAQCLWCCLSAALVLNGRFRDLRQPLAWQIKFEVRMIKILSVMLFSCKLDLVEN